MCTIMKVAQAFPSRARSVSAPLTAIGTEGVKPYGTVVTDHTSAVSTFQQGTSPSVRRVSYPRECPVLYQSIGNRVQHTQTTARRAVRPTGSLVAGRAPAQLAASGAAHLRSPGPPDGVVCKIG